MPLRPDLEVFSQNAWPSLRWDAAALFGIFPGLFSAGFYHKTFIWPSWHAYEHLVRQAAGIGRVRSPTALAGTFCQQDVEVDVVVCGGGSAGTAAADEASHCGASVLLLHRDVELGGRLSRDYGAMNLPGGKAEVRVLLNTLALGVFGDKVVCALQDLGWGPSGPRWCLFRIRAKAIIIATGAIEQPLIFEHNDRVGVMLAGGVSRYLDRYAVRAGDAAVLVTNNDEAYGALSRWRESGIALQAIIDTRMVATATTRAAASTLGAPLIMGPRTMSVLGGPAARGVRMRDAAGKRRDISCDVVAMSGGWAPSVALYSQAQGKLRYEAGLQAYIPADGPPGVFAVGRAAGLVDATACKAHATLTGEAAAAHVLSGEGGTMLAKDIPRLDLGPTRLAGREHRQWLDYQHDVTVADVAGVVEEGYTHVEHFKRYTTTGMALDQGKTSVRNALDQLAQRVGRTLGQLRPPTDRPPFVPLPLAAAAGPNTGRWYRAERLMPCHAEHETLRARFEDVGGWRRPVRYELARSSRECVEGEIHAVRSAVALFESSPLGKIEVAGPDAREFLDRMYVNNLRSLGVGDVRYVLMLRDNGCVMEDGTVARTGPDEFLVTTTSGNAERVYLWLREWAECEWPELKVFITPVTTAWGTVTLSGPKARAVFARAGTNIDLAAAVFPHMTLRIGEVAGIPARVYRVSFTGEVSYEINVPAMQAPALWRLLWQAGAPDALRAYGIDALDVLRTEKGYIHVGADTDATTTPLDLGWGNIIERKPGDFVGRRALVLPEYQRPERLQLIGVMPAEAGATLANGAHLIRPSVKRSEGYLTSAYFSPTLGHAVALGRLESGRQRIGEELMLFDEGRTARVRVVSPVFYDPANSRLRG